MEPFSRRTLLAVFLLTFGVFGLTSGGHGYSVDDELKFDATRAFVHLDPSVPRTFGESFDVLYRDRPDGGQATVYGIGQSIAAAPFYVVGRGLAALGSGPGVDVTVRTATFLTNSAIGALLTVVVALLCRELGASRRGALLLAFAYAFGTFAFPMMKTFGAEPGTALLVTSSVLAVVAARRAPHLWLLGAGGCLGALAALFRISALTFLPLIGLYVLVVARAWPWRTRVAGAAAFGGGAAAGLALLLATNVWRYGDAFDIGYEQVDADYPLARGLLNVYFSFGKSYFLFAPVAAVGLLAACVARRRFLAERLLLLAIIGLNSVTIARLPVWSGDHAWGPRYMQVVLPVTVALAAPLVDRIRWRRAVVVSGVAGLLLPASLGVLIPFDVFLIDAQDELGTERVVSEDQPLYIVEVRHDPTWNQILGNLELLPGAVRDVTGTQHVGDVHRGDYAIDPTSFYGFYGLDPRIDFWWLWLRPTHGSRVTYVLLVPLVLATAIGAGTLAGGRWAPAEVTARLRQLVVRRGRRRATPGPAG
jgi:hypothetical protein